MIGIATTGTEQGNLFLNGYVYLYGTALASLVAQQVRNPPAMQETLIWFLGWEDPLEKG